MKIRRLKREEFEKETFGNFDITFAWSTELQKLILEKDKLFEDNAALKMKIIKLEEEVEQLKGIAETATFVSLYA